jgi:hypothetical protein
MSESSVVVCVGGAWAAAVVLSVVAGRFGVLIGEGGERCSGTRNGNCV